MKTVHTNSVQRMKKGNLQRKISKVKTYFQLHISRVNLLSTLL